METSTAASPAPQQSVTAPEGGAPQSPAPDTTTDTTDTGQAKATTRKLPAVPILLTAALAVLVGTLALVEWLGPLWGLLVAAAVVVVPVVAWLVWKATSRSRRRNSGSGVGSSRSGGTGRPGGLRSRLPRFLGGTRKPSGGKKGGADGKKSRWPFGRTKGSPGRTSGKGGGKGNSAPKGRNGGRGTGGWWPFGKNRNAKGSGGGGDGRKRSRDKRKSHANRKKDGVATKTGGRVWGALKGAWGWNPPDFDEPPAPPGGEPNPEPATTETPKATKGKQAGPAWEDLPVASTEGGTVSLEQHYDSDQGLLKWGGGLKRIAPVVDEFAKEIGRIGDRGFLWEGVMAVGC